MIELDHTSQSYTLNHNEIGRVRGFQTEVEEMERQNEQMIPQIRQHEIPYSEVRTFYKTVFKVLEDIEKQQVEIDDSLHELRKGERSARKDRYIRIQIAQFETFCRKTTFAWLAE